MNVGTISKSECVWRVLQNATLVNERRGVSERVMNESEISNE